MTSTPTLAALLLDRGEGASAPQPVLEAPGRPPLDGAAFAALVRRTGAALNGAGIGREDRVAIVLPNGPEMAAAFLAVAASATTAPLNPAYKVEELDFYLGDLGARALVVEAGADTPAHAVAARRGIPVIEALPIRGPNVTPGYENNPAANASAFTDGWFRTGDQGRLDPDGYLEITGRLKELINRGGEKISPIEVDEVLMDHPAVAQAVAFAVPHPQLGEEVGVAIVLRDGAALTEREARDAVAARLAPFKVPKHVVFVAEIPKGATGKLQRLGLARILGLAA